VQMSVVDVPIKTIQKLPVLLGEVDVLKSIQLLPGVQSGTEGSSGIYVRGGGPDQNLILLDGVPVYNVNHLFGFFSVFNGYAISDITLYKGGFPARYSGRLSSVLDIRMKEGNMKKYAGEVSIGIIASKFTLEGPIVKDKTSFIISGRRTYLDLLTIPFQLLFSGLNTEATFFGGYFFHDLNAKINHKISDKDRIFLSTYMGRDKVYMNMISKWDEYQDKTRFDLHWGNITTALRWNHVFSPKLFANFTLTYSQYNFVTEAANEYQYHSWSNPEDDKLYTSKYSLGYFSGIIDEAIVSDFDYNLNSKNRIKFGTNYAYRIFKPGISAMSITDEGEDMEIDTTWGNTNLHANEFTIYAEDEISINKAIKVNLGVNYSNFAVRDTIYDSWQPRIAARVLMSDKVSLKFSYSHMTQYLHFLTNTSIGLPTDLWLPVTDLFPPETSIQYAAGIAIKIFKKYNFSIEGYYKTMENLIEYKEGASFLDIEEGASVGWESKVLSGRGWAYGAEFLIEKNIGDLSGWIGYTLSWTNRQFDEIAFGKVFPYRYDSRHDIGIALIYKINDHIDMGATWVYGTGSAVTLAEQRFLPYENVENYLNNVEWGTSTSEYYGSRNNYRMPAYHRLDIGFNFMKEKKRGTRTWSFGLYNAYNRQNAFYVDFNGGLFGEYYSDRETRKLVKYSLFPIIPSVSYNFKFK